MFDFRVSLLVLVVTASTALTQPSTQPGSARRLVADAVAIMKQTALTADQVDWPAVERDFILKLPDGAPQRDAWNSISAVLLKLNDPHCRFMNADEVRAWRAGTTNATTQAASTSQPAHPPIPTAPEGQMLEGHIAYVVVPGCASGNPDDLKSYARQLRQTLVDLAGGKPTGWIIELRLNGGGNVWPMLLGLQPLLGDGPVATSCAQGRVQQTYGCTSTSAWLEFQEGRRDQLAIPDLPMLALVRDTRIAILIHAWTMSSAELICAAFHGQPNTRTFGEPTGGYTTSTNFFELSDGSMLVLSVSVMADRDGKLMPQKIAPEVRVPFDNWPSATDKVADAARAWIAQAK